MTTDTLKSGVSESHEAQLRRLGFPEHIIAEVVRAQTQGLFDHEPSPDDLERLLAQYPQLLRK